MVAPICQAKSLDHIVLTVKNIDETVAFYQDLLGMQHTSFVSPSSTEETRHALLFGEQKINLHLSGQEFEPKAQNVQPGSCDLCFLVGHNIEEVLKGLKQRNIKILEGGEVVQRIGAMGKLLSVCISETQTGTSSSE